MSIFVHLNNFNSTNQKEVEKLPDWVMRDYDRVGSKAIAIRSDLIHQCETPRI